MEPDKNWIACPWCGKRFLPTQGKTFPTAAASTASTAAAASSRTMKDEFEACPMTRTEKKPPEDCASRRLVQNETPQPYRDKHNGGLVKSDSCVPLLVCHLLEPSVTMGLGMPPWALFVFFSLTLFSMRAFVFALAEIKHTLRSFQATLQVLVMYDVLP
ncbi:uncharacterized protein LOC144141850 [Haemaphysalis longicornis]